MIWAVLRDNRVHQFQDDDNNNNNEEAAIDFLHFFSSQSLANTIDCQQQLQKAAKQNNNSHTQMIAQLIVIGALVCLASCQLPQPAAAGAGAPLFSSVCQSGIREDNTNYIYCARRGLHDIPLFNKNNVVYDELVLADNKIARLTAASFARIKVKKIFLNGNPLRHVEAGTFARLENHLEELWLDADSASASAIATESGPDSLANGLPAAVVNHLRNLNKLRLKGLHVPVLGDHALKRLGRLELLSLQFCAIERIEPAAFAGLHNTLKELYLDGNQLQSVPSEALLGAAFRSLRVLSLAQNQIKSLAADSFARLSPALVRLDLSYNGLRSVDAHVFRGLNASILEQLFAQNNELSAHSLRFVRQLTGLRELNLDFNLIGRMPSAANSAPVFADSARLQLLSLQGNSIVFDEDDDQTSVFEGLVGLHRLNLARNGLRRLPDGVFGPLRALRSLVLDKNPVENLNERTFAGLEHSLLNVSMQSMRMRTPAQLRSLRALRRIERVKLAHNELAGSVDMATFEAAHASLAVLDMQNNRIEAITWSVKHQQDDQDQEAKTKMSALVELDLANNKLCFVDARRVLVRMPRLRSLGLGQNPLRCDCHLAPLYEWTRARLEPDALAFVQWQCENDDDDDDVDEAMPRPRRRRLFTSLRPGEFACTSSSAGKCPQSTSQNTSTSTSTSSTSIPIVSSSSSAAAADMAEMDSFVVGSGAASKRMARISNIRLSNVSNAVDVEWELDGGESSSASSSNEIRGFKISYGRIGENNNNNNNNQNGGGDNGEANTIGSFVADKRQRSFRIDNLAYDTRYTVCVSILRTQGYDKYCKDIAIVRRDDDSEEEATASRSPTALFSSSAVPSFAFAASSRAVGKSNRDSDSDSDTESTSFISSPFVINNNNKHNTNGDKTSVVVPGLMISVIVVLVAFIVALALFSFVYLRKCQAAAAAAAAASAAASAAVASNAGAISPNKSDTTIDPSSGFDRKSAALINLNMTSTLATATATASRRSQLHHQLLSASAANHYMIRPMVFGNNVTQPQQQQQQQHNFLLTTAANAATMMKTGGTASAAAKNACDTSSTASSSLSSVNNNNNKMILFDSNGVTDQHQQWLDDHVTSATPITLVMTTAPNNGGGGDVMASSPSSFTHFQIGQQQLQQQQQHPVNFIPYELYNSYATGVNNMQQQHQQQQQQAAAAALKHYFTLSAANANHNQQLMTYGFLEEDDEAPQPHPPATTTATSNAAANANSDHVYCEIPSTLNRPRCPPPQQQAHFNSNFVVYDMQQQQQQQQQQQRFMQSHRFPINNNSTVNGNVATSRDQQYSQQNSSASLLISSSASSSASSSPSNNNNSNVTHATVTSPSLI